MKTITGLRNDLLIMFEKLQNGQIDIEMAAEVNNTAGKIINTAKVQLAYHALRKESPNIPFLGDKENTEG